MRKESSSPIENILIVNIDNVYTEGEYKGTIDLTVCLPKHHEPLPKGSHVRSYKHVFNNSQILIGSSKDMEYIW